MSGDDDSGFDFAGSDAVAAAIPSASAGQTLTGDGDADQFENFALSALLGDGDYDDLFYYKSKRRLHCKSKGKQILFAFYGQKYVQKVKKNAQIKKKIN